MDVDLLRPGTCPISPDTILWFEFLLDPNLLKKHLSKPFPDPSPTDLIIKFSYVSPEPQLRQDNTSSARVTDPENPESPLLSIVETDKYSRKHLALKILCLKVAAHLKWNLNILETKLPPHIQFQLMQDLVYMATDGSYSIPPQLVSEEVLRRGGVRFSMVLYHRWLLRFLVNRALLTRQPKQEIINLGVMSPEFAQLSFEQLVRQSEDSRKYSLIFLTELTEKRLCTEQLKIPTADSFVTLTEDCSELTHDWEAGECTISDHEFLMQINYDLCSNYFFYGQYDLARKHILMCSEHKDKLTNKYPDLDWVKMEYASVTEAEVLGYMKALNILQEENGLLHDLQEAISNNYSNLIAVLQEDNLKREIPLVHRLVVELDIQGSSSSGLFTISRDLLNKVAALNAVRSVLEGNLPSTHMDFNKRIRNLGPKFVETLFWALTPVLTSNTLSSADMTKIKHFLLHLATSEHPVLPDEINKYLAPSKIQVFDADELEYMCRDLDLNSPEELPLELLTTDWHTPDFNTRGVPELEMGCLRQQLMDATTADRIRECLVDLARTNPVQPLWMVNPQWKLPAPIQTVVMSLPRSFLQDFTYILLGKARQHAETGAHELAIELLLILESEAKNQLSLSTGNNPTMYKLYKLVGWEALLSQITQVLADWKNYKSSMASLVPRCNMCLAAVQSADGVVPRIEIREMCYMLLLNCGEWAALSEGGAGGVSRASGPAEALATACQQLTRTRQNKRAPKDLWDMVLPIFATNYYGGASVKRSNSGNPVYGSASASNGPNRDSQQVNTKMRDGMVSFFAKLRDPTVLSVVISLLARLFNILKDDSNMDLSMEYINLWPSSVPSTNLFSSVAVSDTLHQLVTQALLYYPDNMSWIKLLGDMCLVGGHYSAAMKQYLSALTIASDHFAQPLSKQSVEDQTIFKRMIKCCTQLNCPTQAAVLCQFLEETDYVLAFKCLAEMSHLCADAMDSYYGCIWDTAILEYLINLHHKRGETHRKQLAVRVMGMLELNSNNNEEIQREAANSRKAKFMRALVRQYVC